MAPKLIESIEEDEIMFWSVCPFCEVSVTYKCTECLGTDTDAIPWSELFKDARITYGPCRGPERD